MLKYPSPNLDLYKALLQAYERCLENKPHVKKTSFHLTFEKTIHGLALEIQNRTYLLLSEFKPENFGKLRLSIPNELFHSVTNDPSDQRQSNLSGLPKFFGRVSALFV